MSKYDTPENLCIALTAFITEIRNQSAAIRAYDNVFQDKISNNTFLQRAYDSIWRELISEIALIFDNAGKKPNENCTLLRLKNLCLNEQYILLFPDGEKDELIQALDSVFDLYNQLPIKKARNKQLSHHDLKQLFAGEPIELSVESVENLIANTTDVFSKIYTHFLGGIFEISFPDYKILVECFEKDIKKLNP